MKLQQIRTMPINQISLDDTNHSRVAFMFDPKERAKDLELVMSYKDHGVIDFREHWIVCDRYEDQPVKGLPIYNGQDLKVKRAGATIVWPAQMLEKVGRSQAPKETAKKVTVVGNRRYAAILYANVLRIQEGLEPITEVIVCDYGFLTPEEKITLCLEENTRKAEGLLLLDTFDKLAGCKKVFAMQPNVTEAQLKRKLGLERGQAQAMFRIGVLDSKYPEAHIIERTCSKEIPWLAQRGMKVYEELSRKPFIAIPPPEGATDLEIRAHNVQLFEDQIVKPLQVAGENLKKNEEKDASKPKVDVAINDPSLPEIVKYTLSAQRFNDLPSLNCLCLVASQINSAVETILSQFGTKLPEYRKPEAKSS